MVLQSYLQSHASAADYVHVEVIAWGWKQFHAYYWLIAAKLITY